MVPLFAIADFRSTMSMLNIIFSCCFGCFVGFVCHHDHFLFSLLQHLERFGSRWFWNFAVAFSSDDLLALFQFDACRLSLLARQVRLNIAAVHRFEINITGWLDCAMGEQGLSEQLCGPGAWFFRVFGEAWIYCPIADVGETSPCPTVFLGSCDGGWNGVSFAGDGDHHIALSAQWILERNLFGICQETSAISWGSIQDWCKVHWYLCSVGRLGAEDQTMVCFKAWP